MTKASVVQATFVAALGLVALPLACGDDERSPKGNEAGSGGVGAEPTGGVAGAESGGGPGGHGGEATGGTASGGSSGNASGGAASGGTSGVTGGASGAPGGQGGDSEGGGAGASAGGEGGEPWFDETVERSKRICAKGQWLNCPLASTCVEDFRWMFNAYPECGPYSERMLNCIDQKATAGDFVCFYDRISIRIVPDGPCFDEFLEVNEAGCVS